MCPYRQGLSPYCFSEQERITFSLDVLYHREEYNQKLQSLMHHQVSPTVFQESGVNLGPTLLLPGA